MKATTLLTATLAVLLTAPTVEALVNPALQPIHLYERYKVVLAAKVVTADLTDDDVDVESGRIRLKVSTVCKGEFAGKEIAIDVPARDDRDEPGHEASEDWNIWDVAYEDRTFVAFVGKTRRRGEHEILLYCGDRQWHHARITDPTKPSAWTYESASADIMVGTFNGDSTRLADMLVDTNSGTAFFPADVNVRLNRDVTIGTLPGGVRGVALFDIDGDGMNDLLLGHVDGEITLVLSSAADVRKPTEHPTYHAKKLQQTCIVSVALKGHGVVGADVRLVDREGNTAVRRTVGTQVLTGCRGPDTVNLAVREPGDYTLRVRFADGTVKEEKITVGETKHVSLTVSGG